MLDFQSHLYDGESPSGKAPDFDSGIRRFDPCLPSQNVVSVQANVSETNVKPV